MIKQHGGAARTRCRGQVLRCVGEGGGEDEEGWP